MLRTILLLTAFLGALPSFATEYTFEVEELQQIVKDSVAMRDAGQMNAYEQVDYIRNTLAQKHPGKINMHPKWMYNETAGTLGQIQILYCTPHEYMAIFGSSVGTDGHSGRYGMDVWDIMMSGEMWAASQGQLEKEVYKAGETAILPQGKAKAYKIPEYGYMLDYGRGNVIGVLQQGVVFPAIFVNQDFSSMKEQLGECGKSMISNWWQNLKPH
ncbi:MAG: hypothetical protein H7249_06015 [Chitinophagaceae bacterium]|nr:hypothetical protein [Oligoflexus sp.]